MLQSLFKKEHKCFLVDIAEYWKIGKSYFETINLKQSAFYTTYSFKIPFSERKCNNNIKNRESKYIYIYIYIYI